MHPAFWPLQEFVFWCDVLMLPWKMLAAPVADSLNEAVAAASPAATVGLDPVSSREIGTSATDFRKDADARRERDSMRDDTNKAKDALEHNRDNPGNPGGAAPGHSPDKPHKDSDKRQKGEQGVPERN